MVAGHLREKNGIYHIVLSYIDENGVRKTPSKSTKLPVKGNKKRAEEMLRKAATMAVCKINIDSDLRLAVTSTVREHFALNPSHFDPRQYLGPAREAVKEIVKHKLVNVLGCNGKA